MECVCEGSTCVMFHTKLQGTALNVRTCILIAAWLPWRLMLAVAVPTVG